MKYKIAVAEFAGDLPRHAVAGPNRGRVDRAAVAKMYGLTLRQMTKAYVNWQDIFRIEGSDLTYRQYLDKMKDAGITPDQIGNGRDQHNLSRYGDDGVYTIDNCRFISRVENEREQYHPPATVRHFSCKQCGSAFSEQSNPRDRVFCTKRCGIIFNKPWMRRHAA